MIYHKSSAHIPQCSAVSIPHELLQGFEPIVGAVDLHEI